MLCEQGRTGMKDVDGKLNSWIEEVEGFPIYKQKQRHCPAGQLSAYVFAYAK